MKKFALTTVLLVSMAFAQETTPVTTTPAPTAPAPATVVPPTATKQVHIVVGDFKCASYNCDGQVIADALTNALMQTNRFAVYERAEFKQGATENMINSTGADGQIQGADVIVVGTVTSLGDSAGSGNACFLGVCLGQKTERITANLRIFDVKSSRVIGTAQVEGLSTGTAGSLNFRGLQLGGNQNSGIDKAIAAMLNDAVQKLSATIPAQYYR